MSGALVKGAAFNRVLGALLDGATLKDACKQERVHFARFIQTIEEDTDAGAAFGRAMRVRAFMMADEVLEIADDSSEDYSIGERGGLVFNKEHVQRSKLRVDTRLKLMAAMHPDVYGNKAVAAVAGAAVSIRIDNDDARIIGLA